MNATRLPFRFDRAIPCRLLTLLVLALVAATGGKSAEVWSGPYMGFTNLAGSDPAQASSQDRITPSVWLTRASTRGIYNIVAESGYTHSLSPIGTEWAYGELTNYSSLIYNSWEGWFGGVGGGGPQSTVGRNAVLHVIPEDIFIAVRFTSFGGSGGGFSYLRSTPSVPEPSAALLTLMGLAVIAVRVRRGKSRQF